MKIDFNAAWAEYGLGEEITVSNSSPAPQPGTPEWHAWRSHNFTGTVIAKEVEEDGSRCLVVEFEHELGSTAYHVSERVYHQFERTTPTLNEVRAVKWEETKAARTEASNVVYVEPYGLFDADMPAKTHASGTVLMMREALAAGFPFEPIGWTLADDSEAVIETMDELVRVAMAIGKHSLACHAIGRVLRNQIEVPVPDETPEDAKARIEAIDPFAVFTSYLAPAPEVTPPVDEETGG